MQVFDAISYRKGASILRMLSTFVGFSKFMDGVALYLKQHRFGNATTVDLWKALTTVLHEQTDQETVLQQQTPAYHLPELMFNWTRYSGFPVVSVHFEEGANRVRLSQRPFGSSHRETGVLWQIPLQVTCAHCVGLPPCA
jgi:aminopeptidase 2